MRSRVLFFASLVVCLMSALAFAQIKKDSDEVVKVDTQLVDVPVVVTDKLGKPILNLKQSNFIIYEDGKKQELSDFSSTSAPFEVALLLDTSGSTRSELQLIQRAAQDFVAALRPGDR